MRGGNYQRSAEKEAASHLGRGLDREMRNRRGMRRRNKKQKRE